MRLTSLVVVFSVATLAAACGDNNPAKLAVCGDGIMAGDEACDDGNTIDDDDCSNQCTIVGCGDGVVAFDEACDDGNQINGDGCDVNCTESYCGNGIQTDVEACDDGNTRDGDGCDSNCKPSGCGNGATGGTEECDDANDVNGDGCDINCTVSACGNGIKAGSESCDDGNGVNLDGCSTSCNVEVMEIEPNEDGSIAIDGDSEDGNDFSIVNADMHPAITASTTVIAAISPAGDEDVFKVTNAGTKPVKVRLDTWNLATGYGIGMSCGTGSIDTVINVRNAAGVILATNNDRPNDDYCSGLDYGLMPGESVYVHVISWFDDSAIASYALDIIFNAVVCGDGDVGPGEQCDDNNSATGDGCSDTCQIEGAVTEVEPNEDGSPSTGGDTLNGNDFGSANANTQGPITANATIVASIMPNGDEDVFAIKNTGTTGATVNLDVWNLGLGFGINVPCGTVIDTVMSVRDASGALITQNDDRNGSSDYCSTLTIPLLPNQTRYVHIIERGDDALIGMYALQVKFTAAMCGDMMIGVGEQCDDGNTADGDGCDAMCKIEPVCGDGVLQPTEQCDDMNTTPADGCSATCQLESAVTEMEPNEDGNVFTGGSGITGNDFGIVYPDMNTLFSSAVTIAASLDPAGDEDVFKFTNPGTTYAIVSFDTWNLAPGFGLGVPCAQSIDTGLTIRSATGTSLASNNDRNGATDRCAGLTYNMAPGATVYAHVVENGDNATVASYALKVAYAPVVCGDTMVGPGEMCDDGNTTNGDGCDATCQKEPKCGDNVLDATEQCDDNNMANGDGCSSTCQLENAVTETEPNDDGMIAPGTGTDGNDFSSTNANGPFSMTTRIAARLSPVGDEDVFAITNPGSTIAVVKLDVWNIAPGFGVGVACGTSIDTFMHIRDAAGVSLASNDDRNGASDRCSTLTYNLAPGATVYAHVLEYQDDAAVPTYALVVDITPTVCGDTITGPGETCDDGNTTAGDGCSSTCQIEAICGDGVLQPSEYCDDMNLMDGDGCSATCHVEGALAEVEPNGTTAEADASTVQVSGSALIEGTIPTIGDLDNFKFTLATPTVIRLETFTSIGECATGVTLDLRLKSSTGTLIVADTAGSGIRSCGAIVMFLAAGTYYAQVEERGNNATVSQYLLEIAYPGDDGAEVEPNNTFMTATTNFMAHTNAFASGDHLMNADIDVWAITVPPGKGVRAEIIEGATTTCESFGVDSRLTLLGPTGAQLVDDDDEGRGFCSMIDGTGSAPLDTAAKNTTAMPQTWYLQVRQSSFVGSSDPEGQFLYRVQVTIR